MGAGTRNNLSLRHVTVSFLKGVHEGLLLDVSILMLQMLPMGCIKVTPKTKCPVAVIVHIYCWSVSMLMQRTFSITKIVAGEETWTHHFEHETPRQ